MVPRIITTSWDDGHPLDMRVASILARHALRGTFYVPVRPVAGRVIGVNEMRELMAMGMEIGSHTVTHPILTELPQSALDRELRESRSALENALGRQVTSFCYPKGRFNARVVRRAALAGYRVCRTTVDYHIGLRFNPIRMPVSLHLFPQSVYARYRHALRYRNWRGLQRRDKDMETCAGQLLDQVDREGGAFHLWGHSWEIEEHGLWPQFERMVARMARLTEAAALTNGELANAIQS